MQVALIHDWLTGMRGGERCLHSFLKLYPKADVYTLLHIPGRTTAEIDQRVVEQSFLQKIPLIQKFYRGMLPLYPQAVNSLKLAHKKYDLVISLSHAAAKNVTVPRGVPHICYCFSPMRYIWDQCWNYFGWGTPVLWPILSHLRRWDYAGSKRIDQFVAISRFVAARIRCFYGIKAKVIYPPVEQEWIWQATKHTINSEEPAFLYAGALVPYKRPELVIQACTELDLPLWVVGEGPLRRQLERMAGPRIKFFGRVPDAELANFFSNCRALIFPGTEDFGMIPIECMAAGRPVIAHRSGGIKETVTAVHLNNNAADFSAASGILFGPECNTTALIQTLRRFIENEQYFNPTVCKKAAQRFLPQRFFDDWNGLMKSQGFAC